MGMIKRIKLFPIGEETCHLNAVKVEQSSQAIFAPKFDMGSRVAKQLQLLSERQKSQERGRNK
jgi:hypothetical protein